MRREDDDLDFGYIPEQGMDPEPASAYVRHKLEVMDRMTVSDKGFVTAVKTIMLNGTSLTVNITREVKELGLDRGDRVMVILKPMDE